LGWVPIQQLKAVGGSISGAPTWAPGMIPGSQTCMPLYWRSYSPYEHERQGMQVALALSLQPEALGRTDVADERKTSMLAY